MPRVDGEGYQAGVSRGSALENPRQPHESRRDELLSSDLRGHPRMPVRTRTPVTCTFTFQRVSPGDAPILHILNTFHCLLVLDGRGGGGFLSYVTSNLIGNRARLIEVCPGVFHEQPTFDLQQGENTHPGSQGAAVDDVHGWLCVPVRVLCLSAGFIIST